MDVVWPNCSLLLLKLFMESLEKEIEQKETVAECCGSSTNPKQSYRGANEGVLRYQNDLKTI